MKFWKFILIFSVVILAYWQTMFFFVWQDDHAVMFKLQHPIESAGQFGTGIYDRSSSYRGVISLLLPIYNLFGTNTVIFYSIGMIVYFVAALSVYFLIRQLTKNKNIAFSGSLIFASGYVGAESLWRIFNSIHTSHTIIALCLTLILYKKFIDQKILFKKLLIYILTIFLFSFTIDTGFVRAHGFIFAVVGLEMLWNFHPLFSLVRLLPFLVIFYRFYIESNTAASEITSVLAEMYNEQNLGVFLIPFKNLHNMFIPSLWQIPLWLFTFLLILILIKLKNKVLWFSLILMIGSYVVFFIHTPTQVFPSLHRYFLIAAVGSAIFISTCVANIYQKKYLFLATGFIVLMHIILLNLEHYGFIKDRSMPARDFYQTLKKEMPQIPIGSLLYFKVKNELRDKNTFENAIFGVGSMPNSTAIAWQYNIDRYGFYLAFNALEASSVIKSHNIPPEKVYTFYYSLDSGLIKNEKK